MLLRPMLAVLAIVALFAAALAAACSGGVAEEQQDARAREIAVLSAEAQRAQLIAALEPLNPLRYHQLDRMIREDGRVPTDALVWAERARQTLSWVSWPPDLRDHVAQYAEWLDSLLAELKANDAAAAAEPSRIVHALAHTFEASVEAWLNGASVPSPPALAGLEPPVHQHESESDDGGSDHEGMSMDDEESDEHQQDSDGGE